MAAGKRMQQLASGEHLWRELCRWLWEGKQNHPFERWVSFPRLEDSDLELEALATLRKGIARRLERLRAERHDIAATGAANAGAGARRSSGRQAPKPDNLASRFMLAWHGLVQGARSMNCGRASTSTGPGVQATLQHAARVEALYLELRRVETSMCRIQAKRQSSPQATSVAPLSRALVQRAACLESCMLQRVALGKDTNDLCLPLSSGDLLDKSWKHLSWQESYFASKRDATRTSPTHSELRELGEWLILFGDQLETCRFVRGGYGFVDNRAFSSHWGTIRLQGELLTFAELGELALIRREPTDWGWLIQCNNGFVSLGSFDKCTGAVGYRGALRGCAHGGWRRIFPLISHLNDDTTFGPLPPAVARSSL